MDSYIYIYIYVKYNLIERSLEVKLPSIWTEVGRVREEKKKEDQRRERVRGKKMREKVEKSRFTVFFHWFGPLLEVAMSKKCTPLWREAYFEVKMHKTHQGRTTFGSWDVEKVNDVVVRSTFRSQNVQNTPCSDHLCKLRCRKNARRCGEAQFEVKMYKTQTWGFCSSFKSVARRGTLEEDMQRCIFRGRGSTRGMFIRDVRRSGRWFPERGCILEHQIFRFAKMILRARFSTSYDLASLFRGRCNSLDRWNGKISKRIGTRPSALHSTFYFWRKSLRIASFLMLSTSKLRKSRRIASFLTLSS